MTAKKIVVNARFIKIPAKIVYIQQVTCMKTTYLITAIGCIFILAAALMAGCTENSAPSTVTPAGVPAATANAVVTVPAASTAVTPVSTSASVTTILVNSSSNGDILTVPASERVLVSLNENPTTGYMWNATASKGLSVISDTYYPPNTTLIGAGGYHEWILAPDTVGTYTFKATYMRPWEGASSAADTFSLVIEATPE